MIKEQIEQMVQPPLTIVDGVITYYYNGVNEKQRTASIPVDTLLELVNLHTTSEEEAKELIYFTLEAILAVPDNEQRVQEANDTLKLLNDLNVSYND